MIQYFPHLHHNLVPPFYHLPYLCSRWACLHQKKVQLDFFFDERKGEIDLSVNVSWFFAQCHFFACCRRSSNVVILSLLLVAQLLFLRTMSLFFALRHWADNLLCSSAVGPCLLCTMSFFLRTMSLAGGSSHFLVVSSH